MPLRVLSVLGFVSEMLSVAGIIYSLVLRLFTHIWVEGWTLLFIGILLIGGLQMISVGVLGEYIGRIYEEAKQRPLYFTRSILHRRGMESVPEYQTAAVGGTGLSV